MYGESTGFSGGGSFAGGFSAGVSQKHEALVLLECFVKNPHSRPFSGTTRCMDLGAGYFALIVPGKPPKL